MGKPPKEGNTVKRNQLKEKGIGRGGPAGPPTLRREKGLGVREAKFIKKKNGWTEN